ncbi:MAG TPA: thioredoxin family protein [Pirellulaceae bacterium]|nr:thioredoxin family protein [Pirellulaceae bacterium]
MIRCTFVALALVALCAPVFAAELEIGAKAPDFKATGIDGKEYNLASVKDAKAVVVCFTCNVCPVAVAYEDRFVEFQKKYAAKGVKFIAINANKANPAEGIEAMKTRAEEKGFNFPYAFDASGESASEYGARVTPHLFLLDGDRTVAYVGAFDDNQNNPKKHYLTDAVDAVLAGKKVETTNTKAVGCGIRNK